jgi:YcxB-like protein
MHIEYQISEADYIAAIRLFQRSHSRFAQLKRYLLPVLCVVPISGAVFLLVVTQGRGFLQVVSTFIIFCVPIYNLLFESRRLAQRYRESPGIQFRNYVDVDAKGFHLIDAASDRRTPWQDFSAFAEDDTTFIILVTMDGKKKFVITPKRELTPAQIDEFRALLQTHLSSREPGPTNATLVKASAVALTLLPVFWFAIPSIFYYYGVRSLAGNERGARVIPHPLPDTAQAHLTGSSFQAFGCSVQLPWTSSTNPDELSHEESATGGDDEYLGKGAAIASSNDGIYLQFSNPILQSEPLPLLLRRSGSRAADNTRKNFGAENLTSKFNFRRASVYTQPSDTRLFDLSTRNHGVFNRLIIKGRSWPNLPLREPTYELHIAGIRGFQIGDPSQAPLHLVLDLYDPQDRHIVLYLRGEINATGRITQPQINAIIQSLSCS